MEEYGKKELENYPRQDEFHQIREHFNGEDVLEQLKTTMFGGYSKKHVREAINTYKEMVTIMQESFDFQLKDLAAERERISNERTLLKRQLNEELEKNKEILHKEHQYQELMKEYEDAVRELELSREEKKKLHEDYQSVRRQYEELRLKEAEQSPVSESDTVRSLLERLDEMTSYCEAMEAEQKTLEEQLRSMTLIGEELSRMSEKYEQNRLELKDARKKNQRLRDENRSLNQEMESAGQIIAEIMEQFEGKEEENTRLKQQLKENRIQLMSVKKDKLEQESSYLSLMEHTCQLEEEMQRQEKELELTKKELEMTKLRCRELENHKVIRLQGPTIETEEPDEEEDNRRKMEELLKRAEDISRRMSNDETEETFSVVESEVL